MMEHADCSLAVLMFADVAPGQTGLPRLPYRRFPTKPGAVSMKSPEI